jgi:hypothetical protein
MRLPTDTQRLTIVGRTGSGKTQAAVWHLSLRSWDVVPWVVYDYKMDELINSIDGVRHIDTSEVPKHPGIYCVHPFPDDFESVQKQLWKIWERENIGVYVDEGYMICTNSMPNPAFRSILTQGRSKHVPVIILSQRPVWLDRFVFSESDFYQVFALNDARDRRTIQAFAPADFDERLPDYHSFYYDVGADKIIVLKPVPKKQAILEAFDSRMKKTHRVIFV